LIILVIFGQKALVIFSTFYYSPNPFEFLRRVHLGGVMEGLNNPKRRQIVQALKRS
jgi:hypothetical protein